MRPSNSPPNPPSNIGKRIGGTIIGGIEGAGLPVVGAAGGPPPTPVVVVIRGICQRLYVIPKFRLMSLNRPGTRSWCHLRKVQWIGIQIALSLGDLVEDVVYFVRKVLACLRIKWPLRLTSSGKTTWGINANSREPCLVPQDQNRLGIM